MEYYSLNFILLLSDLIVFSSWRRFLQDFLIGNTSRKSARKIYAQQTIKGKILLDYIEPLLDFNQGIFKVYYHIYVFIVVTVIPQYIISLALILFFKEFAGYFLGIVSFLKIVLFLVVRVQSDASRRSKYAFKNSRRKKEYKLKKEHTKDSSKCLKKKKK